METVRDNQGKKVRYKDTQRPLLLSTSGNAAHALLLLPQAAQLWARALYPQVEGCGLPAAVRARISSVEASLTMCPALAHLHMPHTAALTALHVGLAAGRAGECKLCVTGFSAGSYTGAAVAIAWHERQKLPDCKGDFVHIKARLGGVAMPRANAAERRRPTGRVAMRGATGPKPVTRAKESPRARARAKESPKAKASTLGEPLPWASLPRSAQGPASEH